MRGNRINLNGRHGPATQNVFGHEFDEMADAARRFENPSALETALPAA